MKLTDILVEDTTPMTKDELWSTRIMVAEMKRKHPRLYKQHKEYYDNLCKGISG